MKNDFIAGGCALGAALTLLAPVSLRAQPTITASDMFNQPGQYYKAYGATDVTVTGLLGTTGGPQLWDFTGGSTATVYRFDYVAAANANHSADFIAAGAQLAEVKSTLPAGVEKAWLYFRQDPVEGRLVYGFYDPSFAAGIGADKPQEMFSPPLNDFPATLQYGTTWSGVTAFTNISYFGDPEDPDNAFVVNFRFAYTTVAVVDAYGVVNSPGIGFGDCLRVNELVTYDISGDFGDGENMHFETDYVRNFYWIRPGRGIVAQVTSKQSNTTPPGNTFTTAASVLRMFETNHPDPGGSNPPPGIQGLKVTVGSSGGLVQWTLLASVTRYQVEYSTTPRGPWTALGGTTTSNFVIDPAAGKPATPIRFYRVVGLP